ncbi:MAG: rod shape-determining protein RodA [Barnesiella sp.]|nr:rod shape-determining protein RodA [Barnesiella sp.]MBD5375905.1 rod shape-determining protein RodA [Bacteroides sp.]MDE7459959.1 rod shape-determining protein RodA [Paramuribaculum sp.]
MESRNTNASYFRYVDWLTVGIYLLLIIGGVFSVYAASYDFDNASILDFSEFSGKQVRWIGFALALALMLLLIDSRMYETYAYPIYLVVLLIMVVTIFVAPDIKGSRSWLVFGPLRFQPAEFGKFAAALALAKLFSSYNFRLNESRSNYFRALAIIFVPIVLILAQKETGSALAYLALFFVLYREGMSGLVLLFAGCAVVFFVLAVKYSDIPFMGIPLGEVLVFVAVMLLMVGMLAFYCRKFEPARNLFLWFAGCGLVAFLLSLCGVNIPGLPFFLTVLGIGCIYGLLYAIRNEARKVFITVATAVASVLFLFSVNYAFTSVLQPHQQQRIKVTLGMEKDLLAAGYNVNQSKIAIGSGGLSGKGFLNGTQTKLKYVPEQHTDFIFCTIGEEEGFIGSAAVLALFLILILRVIHIAERQPTVFGRVYAYCVASYFIFHIAINIGMVIGLCPVIGIPLPFFSYGGSSLWSFTILLFILLRIDAARRGHHTY